MSSGEDRPKTTGWRRWVELATVVVLAALILAGGVLLWQRRAANQLLEITMVETPSRVIYVGGAVNSPGLYTLKPDASVADALQAAGGVTADADLGAIDLMQRLMQRLKDGSQLYVPRRGETPQRININTAEAWLLEALPGIGEEIAQKIVDSRKEHGPFQRLEDLRDRKLVSPSVFDKIKDKITIGP